MNQTTKTTISDAQLKNEYLILFESGNTDNTNIYEQIRTKYKLAKERHVKMYHSTLLEWQEAKNKAIDKQIQANVTDTLKKANLTKVDRILIAESIALNEDGTANNADKLKALDYLSKIDGDYAPTKTANTDSSGNDIDSPLDILIKKGGKIVING